MHIKKFDTGSARVSLASIDQLCQSNCTTTTIWRWPQFNGHNKPQLGRFLIFNFWRKGMEALFFYLCIPGEKKTRVFTRSYN